MTDPRRFFIHQPDGTREGPFDLTTLMRKQRAGRLLIRTPISTVEDSEPHPAGQHREITGLFAVRPSDEARSAPRMGALRRMRRSLKTGWRFVSHQPSIFVLSSAGIIACFGIAMLLYGALPWWSALGVGVFLYLMLQSVVMVTVLRLYRGQNLDVPFYRNLLLPSLGRLFLMSAMVGILGAAGLAAFVIPGLYLFTLFAFAPFLISEKRLDVTRALYESLRVVGRQGMSGFIALFTLVSLNLLSLLVIITLPVTLPILSVALAELYDDFTAMESA